jgi:hypothetical protein
VAARPHCVVADTTGVTSNKSNFSCEAEKILVENSNKLSCLYTLCIGLETTSDDGTTKPLLNFDDSAFKKLKKKDIKPTLEFVKEEIQRRYLVEGSIQKLPKPKGWTFSKCLQFLMEHPITGDNEISFLTKKAKEVIQLLQEASTPEEDDNSLKKWVGQLPYLRLIHCLLDDDVKDKWIHRNDPKTIQQIDARNSTAREENAFEAIARLWNDQNFKPKTTVSNIHSDFATEIDIGYEATIEYVRATPAKIKDKIAKMKTDLTIIIQNYERSGQGDGGNLEEEDEDNVQEPREKADWGRLCGRTGAFDSLDSFLGPNPSYLLYFWEVLDKTGLLNTTMNRISDAVGVSSPNQVPSVVVTSRMSARDADSEDASMLFSSFKSVIVEVSKEATVAARELSEAANMAADQRHRETTQNEDRRHKDSQAAKDKRVVMKNNLVNKGYLKRRIDTLQDEARSMRFKVFRSRQDQNKNEEEFFSAELQTIEEAIDKCQQELDD